MASYFQWNAGGWSGAQIGATSWLLVGAIVLFPLAPPIALLWLASGIVLNLIGYGLWRMRSRMRAYPAIQLFMALAGIVGVSAWAALLELRPEIPRFLMWPTSYWPFAIVPAIMLWFAVSERFSSSPNS